MGATLLTWAARLQEADWCWSHGVQEGRPVCVCVRHATCACSQSVCVHACVLYLPTLMHVCTHACLGRGKPLWHMSSFSSWCGLGSYSD